MATKKKTKSDKEIVQPELPTPELSAPENATEQTPAEEKKPIKKASKKNKEAAELPAPAAAEPVVKKKAAKPKKEEDIPQTTTPEEAKPVKKRAIKKAPEVAAETPQAAPEKIKKEKSKKAVAALEQVGATAKKHEAQTVKKVTLFVRYHTKFGEAMFVTGNHELLGNGDVNNALPMRYLNDQTWTVDVDITAPLTEKKITYNYVVKNVDGSLSYDWGSDKVLDFTSYQTEVVSIVDSWNFAGFFENAFYTEPFKNVLLKTAATTVDAQQPEQFTHIFKVKAPLLKHGEALVLEGNDAALGSWSFEKALHLSKKQDEDYWTVKVDLSNATFPITYKYAVYNTEAKQLIQYEGGKDRTFFDMLAPNKQTIVNDGFVVMPANTWKGAGVAIPVFSLRTKNSFGAGEFTDIKQLVDWCKTVGLKLVQLLPVNDTTATHSWVDSYPYAAISAFALHPMYLNLDALVGDENKHLVTEHAAERERLNSLDAVDYEAVNKLKWQIIKAVYPLQKQTVFNADDYKQFFDKNKHWLVPYAAFCFFRDQYGSVDFANWPDNNSYNAEAVAQLTNNEATADGISIHYFIQYQLHLQLKDATEYAHNNGIILKGDIAIGVYRNGADTWQHPELFCTDVQAGAPPDDFAVKGQNWGFPTYNWKQMKEDGFAWWKQRFAQMSYYFDAFRIDHILGFFRIWSIPANAVEGIMGHFVPALPVHVSEFHERGIYFDYARYCQPYITDKTIDETFGDQQQYVKDHFLNYDGNQQYQLKPEFDTQKKVEAYFTNLEDNPHNKWLKQSLYDLISNIILFEVPGSNGQQFHFRFGMETTKSLQNLDAGLQHQLRELYINYFYYRQDEFWKKEALQKLPALKRVTNMLICGEDLGMVPRSVPDVMKQLGLLSLEIQRMPKDPRREFFHPNDAPYLSVVTPSTHDMSTVRGWWEEDRELTQDFYNKELGRPGDAPHFCDADINKTILLQHFYSPAMWSIFQLQDLLGMSKELRRDNPHEERINVPANPKHYWRYRMHLTLEDLLNAQEYNEELKSIVTASGR